MVETRLTFDRIRMREIRRKKGLNSKELAKRVGCSADHISRIENGKTPPGAELVEKIAKVLHVPPESLYLPPGSIISPISTSGLTKDESELLEAYRGLSASHRDYLLALGLSLANGGQLDAATIAAEGYMKVQDTRRASVKPATEPERPVEKAKR